jgi:hypothetical protein
MNNKSESNLIPIVSNVTFGYMHTSSEDEPFGGVRLKRPPKRAGP